ncbi:acyl-CoA thioesterase II, partial [Pseudomonas savastanoi pv. glycinea str. race 4]
SFGAPRESMIAVAAEAAPVLKPVEQCPELPFARGVMPDYLRFLDL